MQTAISGQPGLVDEVGLALQRATDHLLSIQSPDGYWWAELESNVTMAAEQLLLERFLGIGDDQRWRKISKYILDRQQADGSWPIYWGGEGDLSVSCEAYFALKVAGISSDAPAMTRSRQFILAQGGAGKARVFTKLWFALFGQFDWRALPAMPPEAILLPARSPFNIYEFASWARATMVPILVAWAYKPVATIPGACGVPELFADPREQHEVRVSRDHRLLSWRNAFLALDAVLRSAERLPWKPLRRRALEACERWIVEHQEADGSWGGIQPPWVYSLIALKCRGYAMDHPVMAKGVNGLLNSFALETGETFTIQPCLSPVWDTALAVTGMREAGLPADHPALVRAGKWLLSREVRHSGDWAVKVRHAGPGGWPFEFANENYPDTDDTAEVLIALRLLDLPADIGPAKGRANAWLRAMQSRDGGWGSFDRDNTRTFVTRIPFADFGATIDPPTEDVTAHILEWLLLDGAQRDDPAIHAALRYLKRRQEADGSWWGRWGVNYVYGLGAVLPALAGAGFGPKSGPIARGARWLLDHQNQDGGWGESCRSYDEGASRGRGPSTASQTAWALLGLLAAGEQENAAVRRGAAYLVKTQAPDGQWHEDEFTGTGFPRDFMLKYHLYRNCWPMWALGRYRRLIEGRPIHVPGSDPWQ